MSRTRTARFTYTAVRSEGGLLHHEHLESIGALDPAYQITPTAYFLTEDEPLAEAQSRAWLRLVGLWRAFQAARQALPAGDAAVRITRDRWLLPLFTELGYGRLKATPAPLEADGRTYPISHLHGVVPLHLMGAGVDLDRPTPGVAGAARTTPHGLLQDLLNRSEPHLWGIVTNGLRLRLLRDFRSLTRQAYLEFDLESIFEGERFADFRLLWLVAHASRLSPAEATPQDPESAPIERWFQRSRDQGLRALDHLRDGVKVAIEHLGSGFLRGAAHNPALHADLKSGALSTQDYYRQLLRLVYQLIFLFVAEDRDVLLPHLSQDAPAEAVAAQARYRKYYATTRLRELALRRRGGPHGDLWHALRLVLSKLYGGCPELGLPPLGSALFSPEFTPHLTAPGTHLASSDLLAALHALCTFQEGTTRRLVAWRSIGADELGSVYESLLELHPQIHRESATFTLATAAGNDRKTSGSYYTPSDLVEALLDSALDPVLDRACHSKDPEAALLALRVCDPACGSGHFLVAAGRRLAHRLARLRAGDAEPTPPDLRHALRDIFKNCLFGVDQNPMAVELCKVSLWMEAIEPGKPLPFLDSHILHGNSLLGATPALLRAGIPDEAFTEIEGDDKEVAKALRRRNRDERSGKAQGVQQGLLFQQEAAPTATGPDLAALTREAAAIDHLADDHLAALEAKARRYRALQDSPAQKDALFVADAFCAAFVWPKRQDPAGTLLQEAAPTSWLFSKIAADPSAAPPLTRETVTALSHTYDFFHWHLAFPQIFAAAAPGAPPENPKHGWSGGFDAILGNPPWEQIELDPRKFFAAENPDIAGAENAAARQALLRELADQQPDQFLAYLTSLQTTHYTQSIIHNSGLFPLSSHGRLNTAPLFVELGRHLRRPAGCIGMIVPLGIATDAFNAPLFQDIINHNDLESLLGFENEEHIFPAVHHAFKFALITLRHSDTLRRPVAAAFFLRRPNETRQSERRLHFTFDDFALLNPHTRLTPIIRTQQDLNILRKVYKRAPISASQEHPWGFGGLLMFMMGKDSHLFLSDRRDTEDVRPLYEAKMIHSYNHRFGTYDGQTAAQANQGTLPTVTLQQQGDPLFFNKPRYWVPSTSIEARLRGAPLAKRESWKANWLLAWRDICRSTDTRTLIATVIPRVAAAHTLPIFTWNSSHISLGASLLANLCSFPLDYIARQKVSGTHLTFGVMEQLPLLPPHFFVHQCPFSINCSVADWLLPRVLELTYTAWDLADFARDHGYPGPPFRWDEERRFWLRAELDAAFFYLYGLDPPEIAHVLDSFWLVRQRDEKAHGTYRTKDAILQIFHQLTHAAQTRTTYQSPLNPPPAHPSLAHPPLTPSQSHHLASLLARTTNPPAPTDTPQNTPDPTTSSDDPPTISPSLDNPTAAPTSSSEPAARTAPAGKRPRARTRPDPDSAASSDPIAAAVTGKRPRGGAPSAAPAASTGTVLPTASDLPTPATSASTSPPGTRAPPSAALGNRPAPPVAPLFDNDLATFRLTAELPAQPRLVASRPPPNDPAPAPDSPPEPNTPTARTTSSTSPTSPAQPAPSPPPSTLTPLPDDPPAVRHLLATPDPDITPSVLLILRALHHAPTPLTKAQLLQTTALPEAYWTPTITTLLQAGLITKQGQARGTRYTLA